MVDKMDISIGTSVVIYTMVFFILLHVVIADPNDALVLKLNKEKNTHLEVRYKGDWGSICYSKPGFDNNAAKVACQQMGFRSGKFEGKTYLPGTNLKIVLQRVTCTGQEDDLSDCQLTAPDASSSCEDAVQVDCESDPALDGLFDVNLKGNPDQANKGILNATKRDLETSVKTGAVCYDSGTAPTVAGIVCKQMGYPGVETQTAASALSSGSLFTAVCKGTEETLAKCTLTPGTTCTSNSVIDVECKLNMTTQTTFDVRLSQSSQVVAGINNGTVEVKKYGKWGVICDTGWDINDASVVCRQLGFKGAVATTGFPTKAKFGQGTAFIGLFDVRLNGPAAHKGIVEVRQSYQGNTKQPWYTPCYNLWSKEESEVVCRQLGYSGVVATTSVTGSRSEVTGGDIKCTGTEQTLKACSVISTSTCSDKTTYPDVECNLDSENQQPFDIRLINGNNSAGTVELLKYGRWGVICDVNGGWNLASARVVCQQLGFVDAIRVTEPAEFGQSNGSIHLRNPGCKGDESSIEKCPIPLGWGGGIYACQTKDTAGVVCSPEKSNEAIVFKVLDKYTLDVRYKGKFGQFCGSGKSFDTQIAGAVCQQMGMQLKESTDIGSLNVSPTQITVYKVKCTTTTLDSCNFTAPQGSDTCPIQTNVGTQRSSAVTLRCHVITNVHLISTGSDPHSGVVEVVRGAERDVVCYDSAKSGNVANVVCKQMGYIGGTATDTSKPAGKSLDISCTSGSEANLDECLVNAVTSGCNTIQHVQCTLTKDTQITFDVRLSNSSKAIAGATHGTVEVFQYGKWGVICDTDWDINVANVVCRQLGFREALGFPTDAKFGQGTGTVFWTNMTCIGNEQSIVECKHDEVLGMSACNSVNAAGVICSSDKLPTFDICPDTDTTISLQGGYSFLQSPGYPNLFSYSSNTTCSCTTTNLKATSTLSVYVNQKMFQQNHVEYLTFINSNISRTELYGDDSAAGSFTYTTDNFTIQFKSDTSSGNGKFRIQLKASEPVSSTCTKGEPTTAPPVTAPITSMTTTSSSSTTSEKLVINKDHGNNAGVAAAVTGVVIVLIGFILGIILWRFGCVRFGQKTRNSNGNGLYDETRVTEGVTTWNGGPGNFVNVGGACDVREPVYVNTAYVADQEIEASQDSSDRRSVYENMGDIVFNQARNADNNTASAELVHESTITVQNQGNDANNSTAADGESQYAKLETVNRSEYADFRGLTAKQLKPI